MKSNRFSEDEYWIMETYKEALDIILGYGKWKKIDDESCWVIPARIKYEVEDMLETLKEDFDL